MLRGRGSLLAAVAAAISTTIAALLGITATIGAAPIILFGVTEVDIVGYDFSTAPLAAITIRPCLLYTSDAADEL